MCYNLAYLEKRAKKLAERYKEVLQTNASVDLSPELPTFYFVSGFSHPLLPVVKQDGIFLHEWGLIPFWVKDTMAAKDLQAKTLNAVGETVFGKPSFRNSIAKKRCLLGVSGFFEWMDYDKKKYPFYIRTKSREILSLGCIYESWVDKNTGEIRNTFSIITTPANSLMEKIHNHKKRMPLILPVEDEKKWIDPNLTQDQIAALIKPYDASDMMAHSVSKAANNARENRNTADIIDEVIYPELNR